MGDEWILYKLNGKSLVEVTGFDYELIPDKYKEYVMCVEDKFFLLGEGVFWTSNRGLFPLGLCYGTCIVRENLIECLVNDEDVNYEKLVELLDKIIEIEKEGCKWIMIGE
jgi:hypothetical protein